MSVPPLPLTPTHVDQLANVWADGGLWNDVEVLVHRFVAAENAKVALYRWHHLLLAVANFKRTAGRAKVRIGNPNRDLNRLYEPPKTITVPAGPRVAFDDPESWEALEDHVAGLAVPTTTTLLAALWPDYHCVFDRRVVSATAGLLIESGLPLLTGYLPASIHRPPHRDWEEYKVIRPLVVATAVHLDRPAGAVERALYQLDKRVPSDGSRTWATYGARISDELSRLGPSDM